MHPSASLLNIHLSIEKAFWDGVAAPNGELLINRDDIATRLSELTDTGHAVLWHLSTGTGRNTCKQNLFVGATYIQDPGNIGLITLVDKVKALLDSTASIPVFDYASGSPVAVVNQLVLIGNVRYWPVVNEPNGFKTKLLSVGLKYGQVIQ